MSRRVLNEEVVDLSDISDNVLALVAARNMARDIGFAEVDQSIIATAVSELATNVVRYGLGGTIALRHVQNGQGEGMEIEAEDSGPGIPDIEKAMTDSYSTEHSLGLGLPGVNRLMDEFVIESSDENGTRCIARKWR